MTPSSAPLASSLRLPVALSFQRAAPPPQLPQRRSVSYTADPVARDDAAESSAKAPGSRE